MIPILYSDSSILVCIKPQGVLSTDEPGGLPELLRLTLGNPNADVRTIHRLDRVVGGLMVLARTPQAASELSRQVREREFEKEYQAVLHGHPDAPQGTLRDLLARDKAERKTYVVSQPGKDAREAILSYETLARNEDFTRIRIRLETGRTHQIRTQFSSRGLPLVGDRKYSALEDDCPIALWSWALTFTHPETGKPMSFRQSPPAQYPWNLLTKENF